MAIVREVRHDPPVSDRRPLLIMAASAVCFALMALAAKLASARLSGVEVAFMRFAIMAVPVLAVPRLLRQALDFQRVDLLIYRGLFGGLAILLLPGHRPHSGGNRDAAELRLAGVQRRL